MKLKAVKLKNAYEKPDSTDGCRILVDRLWPRGLAKNKAKIDEWTRDIAPSTNLRKWYNHDPEKWSEFRSRYFRELDANPEAVSNLTDMLKQKTVTFVYASRESNLNNAVALREYIESISGKDGESR